MRLFMFLILLNIIFFYVLVLHFVFKYFFFCFYNLVLGFIDFREITCISAAMTDENQVDVKDEVAEVSFLHYIKFYPINY